jgi:hypothetical protein
MAAVQLEFAFVFCLTCGQNRVVKPVSGVLTCGVCFHAVSLEPFSAQMPASIAEGAD